MPTWTHCGQEHDELDNNCRACGAPAAEARLQAVLRALLRDAQSASAIADGDAYLDRAASLAVDEVREVLGLLPDKPSQDLSTWSGMPRAPVGKVENMLLASARSAGDAGPGVVGEAGPGDVEAMAAVLLPVAKRVESLEVDAAARELAEAAVGHVGREIGDLRAELRLALHEREEETVGKISAKHRLLAARNCLVTIASAVADWRAEDESARRRAVEASLARGAEMQRALADAGSGRSGAAGEPDLVAWLDARADEEMLAGGVCSPVASLIRQLALEAAHDPTLRRCGRTVQPISSPAPGGSPAQPADADWLPFLGEVFELKDGNRHPPGTDYESIPWERDAVQMYCSRRCCFFDIHGRQHGRETMGRWWRRLPSAERSVVAPRSVTESESS